MNQRAKQPVVLIICDGWGESPEIFGNAIRQANTPNLDRIRKSWPHTTVEASGEAVGLPAGQMGNSEVGHLTIGAGRIIHQALSRQIHEISSGQFYTNETLISAIELAIQRGTDLHIMGLVSPGDIHAHTPTALALAKLAGQLGLKRVHVHAFTDGRDSLPTSARHHIEKFETDLAATGTGHVASISGRYYSMDRDNRWERIEQSYKMLVDDHHPTHPSATGYIEDSYAKKEHDEFLKPISIATSSQDRVKLENGDVVVFFNFRPDRARQLTRALVDADFTEFNRSRVLRDLHVVTIAEYDRNLSVSVAFPRADVHDILAEVVGQQGLHQFHIAETEKYAHVTYYLNGGREKAFPGEERKLIPSPKVATYDLAPAMSAESVTTALLERLKTHHDDLVVVNFANADMVGHCVNFNAIIKGIEVVDRCIAQIVASSTEIGYATLITGDHGNAEYKIDPQTLDPLTAHTTSPVPAILCGTTAKALRQDGGLRDIAPTVLSIMGLPIPAAMTGQSLIQE